MNRSRFTIVTRENHLTAIRSRVEINAQRAVELVANEVKDELETVFREHKRSGLTESNLEVDVDRGRKSARAFSPDVAAEVLEVGRPQYHAQPARPYGKSAAMRGLRRSAGRLYGLLGDL